MRRETVTNQDRRNSLVAPIVLLVVVSFIGGVVIGHTSVVAPVTPAPEPSMSLLQLFSAPGCYIPVGLVSALALLAAGIGAYYGKKRLDAQVRVWRARAEAEETEVERRRVELDDLTPGPDGQEVARVMKFGDRFVLVKPGVVTSLVTALEPETAVLPDQTPDQLTLAAIVASALKGAGGDIFRNRGSGGGSPLDGLALMMAARGLGPGWNEGRVPDNIRVMTEEEAARLESGED